MYVHRVPLGTVQLDDATHTHSTGKNPRSTHTLSNNDIDQNSCLHFFTSLLASCTMKRHFVNFPESIVWSMIWFSVGRGAAVPRLGGGGVDLHNLHQICTIIMNNNFISLNFISAWSLESVQLFLDVQSEITVWESLDSE
jgi:hypothetical protein